MRRTLQAGHDRFALNRPFRISRGVRTETQVVTVTIHDGDAVGRGEGVPYPRYGESIESALAAIEAVRPAIEEGADRQALLGLLPAGAARNAVDCALWDLEARLSGRNVAEMLEAPAPERLASALTVVIDAPDAMARAAAALAGAPLLKVKVDANDPAAQIRAVRAAAPEPALIVDPNESWNRAILEALQPMLIEARVDLLEQPVPAGDDAWLEHFRSAVPICADEAVHVADDLGTVAGRYQVVNVKLDKSGGLTAALELADAARARGLGLMTGCMVSSSLSIAPALHVARMSDFVDLDGPVWLAEDRPAEFGRRAGCWFRRNLVSGERDERAACAAVGGLELRPGRRARVARRSADPGRDDLHRLRSAVRGGRRGRGRSYHCRRAAPPAFGHAHDRCARHDRRAGLYRSPCPSRRSARIRRCARAAGAGLSDAGRHHRLDRQ
jgi:L-alanine-DL-glutamate epimerase-like enolase superfamily enzyme